MLFWTLFLAGAGLLVWLSIRTSIRRSDAEDVEDVLESFRERIALDPNNVGAHELLGDALWRAGRFEEARGAYENALAVSTDVTPTEQSKYRLRLLETDRLEREGVLPKLARDVICPQCGALNPPDVRQCQFCHYALPVASLKEALRLPDVRRSARETLSIALVLALCLHIFTMLPIEIKGCIIMSATVVCSWRFLQAIEGRRG